MDRNSTKQMELGLENGPYYAIAVSDLHLGYDKADKEAFRVFLRNMKDIRVDHLLLVGDVLDMWRRDNKGLIEDNMDILVMLRDLKKNEQVGTIHYVIGNHDFSIELMTDEFGILSDLFTFYPGTSSNRVWVELPLPEEGNKLADKSFKFMHGHQLSAGLADPIIPMYDGICTALCRQGDLGGRITSFLWDLRYSLPLIFLIMAVVAYLYLELIWPILLGLLAIGSFVAIYGIGKRRKGREDLSFNEQVYELLEALPLRTRKRTMDYLKAPPHKRGEFKEISARDIDKAYKAVKHKIDKIERESAHEVINEVLKTLPSDGEFEKVLTILGPNDQRVIGHTHEADPVENPTNLGCWVKGHPYHYLVINYGGHHDLMVWRWKEISRWRRVVRRLRRQKVREGYSRVIQIVQTK
ncbi:MAG: metallophosphoesterase [Candidatus Thorarchaeota archaeon]